MPPICRLSTRSWQEAHTEEAQLKIAHALEGGAVLYFPQLPFSMSDAETALLKGNILQGGRTSATTPSATACAGRAMTPWPRGKWRGVGAIFEGVRPIVGQSLPGILERPFDRPNEHAAG